MTAPWLRSLDDESPAVQTGEPASPGFLDEWEPDPVNEGPQDMRRRVLADAEAEAVRLREEAREQGYADGRAQATREAAAELELLKQLYAASEAALAEREIAYAHLAADFAVEVARRLTTEAVTIDEKLIERVIGDVLAQARAGEQMTLTISPEDEETVRSYLGTPEDNLRIVSDPSVERGSCLLETSQGEIQASTQLALDRLYEAVERAKE